MMVRLISLPLLLTLANSALACVDFSSTTTVWNYATISLVDNGVKTCSVNGYGDNNGWRKLNDNSSCYLLYIPRLLSIVVGLNCIGGYSAYFRFGDKVVEYSAPHGSWTFATNCQFYYAPNGGSVDVCLARVFGC